MNTCKVSVKISLRIKGQLQALISLVVYYYWPIPFHNFDQALQVVMLASKMMRRICEPEMIDYNHMKQEALLGCDIHNQHTHGISSHPFMLFTVVSL